MVQLLNKLYATLPIVLLTVCLIQCRSSESVLAPKVAALVGTWQLVDPDSTHKTSLIISLDTANPPQDITPFLVTGRTTINDYTLRLFATIDGTMSSESWSNTYKMALPAVAAFEEMYFKNLRAVVRYEMPTPNLLYLYHGGSSPHVMTYDKAQ